MTHQPMSVVSQCSLIAWLIGLATGDQRRLTGSGSTALEACSRQCATQMAAFTLRLLSKFSILSLTVISGRMQMSVTDNCFFMCSLFQGYLTHCSTVQHHQKQVQEDQKRSRLLRMVS